MFRLMTRALLLSACSVFCAVGTASAATQATPAPTPAAPAPAAAKKAANPFTYSGYLRAYYFTRMNSPSATGKLNQATYNNALSLHGAYKFNNSGFSLGATYLYANPFNGCGSPASHLGKASAANPCGLKSPMAFGVQPTNFDDTLPGFELNTLYEAYLQYNDPHLFVRAGDQVINTPWANSSDSRLKPVAFQGGDLVYRFNRNWSAEAMYMDRFEDRVDSAFTNTTLLTGEPADAGGLKSTTIIAPTDSITTSGFAYGRLGYTSGRFVSNLHLYAFANIANALWFDGHLGFADSALKPFVAVQAGDEQSTGSAVLGAISSQVFGLQAGITPLHNLDLTIGYDNIPQKTATVTLPAGASCGANDEISAKTASVAYFLPTAGTTNCVNNANGTATLYYGGWASPYTDSYATDPLFTTSISQGMVDRRSPGQALKISAAFTTQNKRFHLIASQAFYGYGNSTSGVSPTQETDIDGQYFFSPVGKGPYHGLSLRERWANRVQEFTNLYGSIPNFVYNRIQLEYDF